MKKRLSIKDIASELNVAKSTVSFILNGKAKEKRISDALAEKVLNYVEEMGFKPNQLARSLSTGKTKMICLMVEKISDYFFSHLAFNLEELAYQHDYKLIYCSTENDTRKTRELIGTMRDRSVDGYIITPPFGIEPEVQELILDGIPVVMFDRYYPTVPTDYVVLDNYQGTYDAVMHLIENDSKEVALVTGGSGQSQMADRMSGYLDAMYQYHYKPRILQIPFQSTTETRSVQIMEFLKQNSGIDAIVFATNYLTISGIKSLNDLDLKFPDDVSVIGFDDHEIFKVYKPEITAVAQPLDIMAKHLFKIMLDKLENRIKLTDLKQVVVPAELKLRGSTRMHKTIPSNPLNKRL